MSQTAGEIIVELGRKYQDGKSFVYREKIEKTGFVIHHLRYRKGQTVTHKQFPKTVKGRNDYHIALKPFYEKWPFDYIIIKKYVHSLIDATPRRATRMSGLARMKRDNFKRLVLAVLLTEK